MTTTIPTRTTRNQYLTALGFACHRCTCGERLYLRDVGQGYSHRTEFVNGDGKPIAACPDCGHPLTARWLQTIAAVLPSGQLARPGRDSQVSYSRAELAAAVAFGSIV